MNERTNHDDAAEELLRRQSSWWICTGVEHDDDRGEGVISAAIAVLIMAFLGALMWVGFKADLGGHRGEHGDKVTEIGE